MDDFVHIEPYGAAKTAEKPVAAVSETAKEPESFTAFLDAHTFVRQTVVDRIYGCIVGSALGDTIGLYTEFLTKVQSANVYPEKKFSLVQPVTEFHPDQHRSEYYHLGFATKSTFAGANSRKRKRANICSSEIRKLRLDR